MLVNHPKPNLKNWLRYKRLKIKKQLKRQEPLLRKRKKVVKTKWEMIRNNKLREVKSQKNKNNNNHHQKQKLWRKISQT